MKEYAAAVVKTVSASCWTNKRFGLVWFGKSKFNVVPDRAQTGVTPEALKLDFLEQVCLSDWSPRALETHRRSVEAGVQ